MTPIKEHWGFDIALDFGVVGAAVERGAVRSVSVLSDHCWAFDLFSACFDKICDLKGMKQVDFEKKLYTYTVYL